MSVIISKDNGYNWDSSNIGLPSTLAQSGTPPTLRYCSGFLSVKNNISVFSDYNQYISYDHGEHWNFKNASSPVTSGVNSYSNLCGAFQNKIFISKDSAGTWKQIFTSVQSGNVYSLSSRNEFVIAGIDNEGVVISKDSGEHWVYINDGLSSLGIRSVTIGKNFIYCGTNYLIR